MKHKIKLDFISYKDTNGTLSVIAKIDHKDIINKTLARRSNHKYKNIDLSIIVTMPNKTEAKKRNKKLRVIEKEILNELSGNNSIQLNNSLFTLRSKVNNRLFNKYLVSKEVKERSKGDSKGKMDSIVELDVTDEMFTESKLAKRFVNKNKLWKKRKQKRLDKNIKNWNSMDFLNYMKTKFKNTYGHESFEFDRATKYKAPKGKLLVVIKSKLIKGFAKIGYDNRHVKSYIDWVYDIKAGKIKFPVTFWFLISDSLITEWIASMSNYQKKGASMRDLMRSKK
jgi:hypothetical protein